MKPMYYKLNGMKLGTYESVRNNLCIQVDHTVDVFTITFLSLYGVDQDVVKRKLQELWEVVAIEHETKDVFVK